MLIVSPSISPLSYNSILISLASVSILLTNAFSLVFNTNGAEVNIFGFCFTTVTAFDTVSVFGLTSADCCSFFGGKVAVFLGGGFEVVAGFGTVAGFVVVVVFGVADNCVTCFTHSRNVISSTAKSFPQPLGLLSAITSINEDVEAGVVKRAKCLIHRGSGNLGSSPVLMLATVFPSVVSNRILRFGNIGYGHLSVGLQSI